MIRMGKPIYSITSYIVIGDNYMIQTCVYIAECKNCKQKFPTLISVDALKNIAEDHMMETGHIVKIEEYD
jgi:hypothetical protein